MIHRQALPALFLAGGLATSSPTLADISLGEELTLYGDVRGGYYNLHREDRDRTSDTSDDWRARLRAGLQWQVGQAWSLATRFAGRYSTAQESHGFALDWHATTPTGLELGESTFDEAYAAYEGNGWALKVGRFRVSHQLEGVARKGLDRNDSPNTEITWTDGVQWQADLPDGWRATVVADYNGRQGPSTARRKPLDYTHSGTRVSGYAAVENAEPWGPVVQRSLSVTYLPDALHTPITGATQDYSALTGRLALRWPLSASGLDFMLGIEAGHAFNTPAKDSLGMPGSGDSNGEAWQISFNLMDLAPGHNIGLVGGRTGAGWLLSPDFTPNSELLEVRYQWRIDKQQRFEARLRYREDIDKALNAITSRQDTDFYLRYTYSF